jgi:hypothetical protein
MSGFIISTDGTVDEQSRAIIGAFNDSGRLLQEWCDMTAAMYPDKIELLATIPRSKDMSPNSYLVAISVMTTALLPIKLGIIFLI